MDGIRLTRWLGSLAHVRRDVRELILEPPVGYDPEGLIETVADELDVSELFVRSSLTNKPHRSDSEMEPAFENLRD